MARHRTLVTAAATAAATAFTLVTTSGAGAVGAAPAAGADNTRTTQASAKERPATYDSRSLATGSGVTTAARAKGQQREADATGRLRALVGVDAQITVDPSTGTPANLASWTGYLTGPSKATATSVALGYVRAHAVALGLTTDDLSTFQLRQDYVDVQGTHHLSFTQSARGVTVFGNGLRAHVTKDGRLIALQGAPVSGLRAKAAASSVSPRVAAAAAREGAAKDVGGKAQAATASVQSGTTRWSNGDLATLVWFVAGDTVRLGWSTYTQSGGSLSYAHVLDAGSGSVLYRRDLVQQDAGDAKVYDYYPGAPKGGTAKVVNFYDKGWLGRGKTWLQGTNVSAWADLNDDNTYSPKEKTPVPGTASGAQFTLQPFKSNPGCSTAFVCTWNPNKAFSWQTNMDADVTNAFYLANTFHDWLEQSSVGFTPAAGNFERVDGDPVMLNALDGANTANGLPDADHIDNANMSTPPDGTPPTMQMYLWHEPGLSPAEEAFLPVSGAFDASILYHEYTHGLSNRLVVDAAGNSTLNSIQAGAMGEAWSDYYAMDYLVGHGFQPDTKADGEVREGKYTLADKEPFRTMAIDCSVGSTAANCTRLDGTRGGYTYGDFPNVNPARGPEVHASGEVWAQTLWDIRKALGSSVTDALVARGMELSSADPTYLDMRNAIIQADKVGYNSAHSDKLWGLFAARGMGWFAGASDGGDAFPAQDFHRPPSPDKPRGTLFGLVTDPSTGARVPGAVVTVAGHPEYTATTNSSGVYQLSGIRGGGTYPKIVASAPGYTVDVDSAAMTVGGQVRLDFQIRRDWAASGGGGSVVDFNGPDYTAFGCGPSGAIDQSAAGWGSTTGDDNGTPTNVPVPKFVEVALPQPVDIAAGTTAGGFTAFAVDPSNVCGDSGSSATNDYRIEVSTNGTTWTTVADAAFGTGGAGVSRGQLFNVAASTSVSGVRFFRYWMDSPQVPDFATNCPAGAFTGCSFTDMTEVQLFGAPSS